MATCKRTAAADDAVTALTCASGYKLYDTTIDVCVECDVAAVIFNKKIQFLMSNF